MPIIIEHRARGQRAVIVRDGAVVLACGAEETKLAKLKDIPLTEAGRNALQIENVLAAVGAAWALGIKPELMRTGIETFSVV